MKASPPWTKSLVISALAIFAPLSLLFFNTDTGFTSDWYNSLWMTGYFAKFFSTHGSFPQVLNTKDFVGIVYPQLYGHVLYPVLGVLGALVRPNIALRLFAVLIYSLQFIFVYKAAFAQSKDKITSALVSTVLLWSIYPMSNLYSRSALPEFFAFSLLLCCVSCWYIIVATSNKADRWRWGFYFATLFALMGGTHAITAFYGSISLLVAICGTVIAGKLKKEDRLQIFGILVFSGILFLLVLSPWLVALSELAKWPNMTMIPKIITYFDGIDHWWVRLFPLPLDYRTFMLGESTPTTHLDAQVSVPLLILLLSAFWRTKITLKHKLWRDRNFWLAAVNFALALLTLDASLSPTLESIAPLFFRNFQIAYRMVNYVNLFWFVALLVLMTPVPLSKREELLRVGVLTLAGCALILKLLHGSVIWNEAHKFAYSRFRQNNNEKLVTIPKSFYSTQFYATMHLRQLTNENMVGMRTIAFPVDSGDNFGEVEPVIGDFTKEYWILTNVYSFEWNKVFIDGVEVIGGELASISNKLAIHTTKNGMARITYKQEPPTLWKVLNIMSRIAFGLCALISILLALGQSLNFQFARLKSIVVPGRN